MLQHGLDKHNVDKEANKWQSVVDHTGQTLKANQIICSREYLSKEMDEYIEARTYVRCTFFVRSRSYVRL
jgi:hypothetical protein